ncbi:MAG: TonB-dependent receptor [bacterium]|nr:TonB-dependent receptor [bacterium]
MRKTLVTAVVVTALIFPGIALSETRPDEDVPEVVVTATRLETPADEVSGTILVISAEELEKKQARTVADVLKGLPGIDLVNQGGAGKASSVLLRGGDTRFTLVLVDGVEVNDPSNPERTYDFAHMSTEDIERIEVLFGPQSTLYGSDAIGGVIQIITKKGTGDPHVDLSVEGGSFGTRRGSVSARGSRGRTAWSLSASKMETDGISAAAEADGNTERDGYGNVTFSGRLEQEIGSGGNLQLNIRSVDATNELDHSGGPGGDDPNYTGDARHLVLDARLALFLAEMWESTFSVSRSAHDRHDLNRPDPVRDFLMELKFEGRSEKAEWINNLYLGENSVLTVGVDSEKETGSSSYYSSEFEPYTSTLDETSATINGVFLQEQYKAVSGMTVTLGVRADDHSDFGGETTWRAGFSVPVSGATRFRAVYGTGFRAPSIDQLFNPDYGSPDLEAERSAGWDVGLETALGSKATASLAWHQTRYDNLIAWYDPDGDPYTWDGGYQNVSEAKTEGVDLSVAARAGMFSMGLNGSLLRTEDDQGEQLLRRPRTRFGAQLGFDPSERASLELAAVRVGERKEWGDVTLEEYTLVDLAASYQITDRVELTGRVQNLLDEEYEEAAGYGVPGRAAYVGIKAGM